MSLIFVNNDTLFMDFTLKKENCKCAAYLNVNLAAKNSSCILDRQNIQANVHEAATLGKGNSKCQPNRCSVHVTDDFVDQNSSNWWLARGCHLIEVRLYIYIFST